MGRRRSRLRNALRAFAQALQPDKATEVKAVVDQWLVAVKARKSPEYHATCAIRAQRITARWLSFADITGPAIESYIDERTAAGIKGITICKETSALRQVLKLAKARGYIAELPSWTDPPKHSDYCAIRLSPAQVRAILAELPIRNRSGEPVRAFCALMWETGFRRGTLWRLCWEDIDLARKTVHVRAMADKARFDRTLPLSNRAARILRELGPSTGLIFGRIRVREWMESAIGRALPPETAKRVTPHHTLRHSKITQIAELTQDVPAIQLIAGHKHLETTQRYLHSSLDRTRKVFNKINRLVDEK